MLETLPRRGRFFHHAINPAPRGRVFIMLENLPREAGFSSCSKPSPAWEELTI